MTEKRFTPRLEHNRIVWITDTVEEKILFGEDTVGLLNMLHEENEQLKSEIKEWKEKYYQAEETVINEYSSNISKDMEELHKEVYGE